MSKKQKKDPIQHEREYVTYLERQLKWMRDQPHGEVPKADIEKMKYKLDKARLVLKSLELKK